MQYLKPTPRILLDIVFVCLASGQKILLLMFFFNQSQAMTSL